MILHQYSCNLFSPSVTKEEMVVYCLGRAACSPGRSHLETLTRFSRWSQLVQRSLCTIYLRHWETIGVRKGSWLTFNWENISVVHTTVLLTLLSKWIKHKKKQKLLTSYSACQQRLWSHRLKARSFCWFQFLTDVTQYVSFHREKHSSSTLN